MTGLILVLLFAALISYGLWSPFLGSPSTPVRERQATSLANAHRVMRERPWTFWLPIGLLSITIVQFLSRSVTARTAWTSRAVQVIIALVLAECVVLLIRVRRRAG